MPAFSLRRATLVFVIIGLCFSALLGRVSYLQTAGREKTLGHLQRQQFQKQSIQARRGSVFDRNGLAIAVTVETQTLFIDPKFMQQAFLQQGRSLVEMDAAVRKLAGILGRDPFELSQLLSDRFESRYIKIATHLDEATVQEIMSLKLPGVGVEPTNMRQYPMGSIASHIIGGIGGDGHGLEGLELKFDQLLAGKDGSKKAIKDAKHEPILVADYRAPQHGQSLILTIDANIQMITEQELARTCMKYRAPRGEAIVMDPKTGEVLAMANFPTFNPQNLEDSKPDTRRNRCIVDPYEPGSTLKPFIAGPALSAGITRINEVWPIPARTYHTSYGRRVTDVHFYGPLATWDGLVKSSNILSVMLAERMGNPRVHAALSNFGFGRPTEIDLPGEHGGRLNPLRRWGKNSTASVAQGYEMMVTPLQLARGFCAYANGGRLVKPTVVKGVLDQDGKLVSRVSPSSLQMLPEVIHPETAAEVRRILCDTVVRGTATGARDNTWNIFGKTGTAHISEGRAGYSATRYNSSFVGGAPFEDPKLVVAFIIHEPDPSIAHYGGKVSGPGAADILRRSLAYMQVPASPELTPPPPQIANVLVNYNANIYRRPKTESASGR